MSKIYNVTGLNQVPVDIFLNIAKAQFPHLQNRMFAPYDCTKLHTWMNDCKMYLSTVESWTNPVINLIEYKAVESIH